MRNRVLEKIFFGSNLLFFASFLIFMLFTSEGYANEKWTSPKFVKEWEVKEIKPGLSHEVVSITTNKNGIFLLVKVRETKSVPLDKVIASMTEKARVEFVARQINPYLFPTHQMPYEEKRDAVDFTLKYFSSPKTMKKITEKEKENVFNYIDEKRKKYEERLPKSGIDRYKEFREYVEKVGRDAFLDGLAENIMDSVRETIIHPRIQQYDLNGDFVAQWPEGNKLDLPGQLEKAESILVYRHDPASNLEKTDSRRYLVNPILIDSDAEGNIYCADYEGNKVVKFDSEGNVLNLWKILDEKKMSGLYEGLAINKGMAIAGNRLYLVYATEALIKGTVPVLTVYDLNGKVLMRETLPRPKMPVITPYINGGTRIPFKREDGHINSLTADKKGNIYLLAGYFSYNLKVLKLDRDFKELKRFEPVLKKGFDLDTEVYDPKTKKMVRYWDIAFKGMRVWGFNSQKGGNPFGISFYMLNSIHLSPEGELFLTFTGRKPFGAINALVYGKKEKMKGYWKEPRKSNSEWFEALSDMEKIEAVESTASLAFHETNLFLAKTMRTRAIVQKFER